MFDDCILSYNYFGNFFFDLSLRKANVFQLISDIVLIIISTYTNNNSSMQIFTTVLTIDLIAPRFKEVIHRLSKNW